MSTGLVRLVGSHPGFQDPYRPKAQKASAPKRCSNPLSPIAQESPRQCMRTGPPKLVADSGYYHGLLRMLLVFPVTGMGCGSHPSTVARPSKVRRRAPGLNARTAGRLELTAFRGLVLVPKRPQRDVVTHEPYNWGDVPYPTIVTTVRYMDRQPMQGSSSS